jgi:CubicO group peptidase (beta-lactamase class C family)
MATLALLLLAGTAAFAQSPVENAFAIVKDAVEKGQAPGASALVARDGRILRQEAYGSSDLENKVRFRTDTLCWLASVTKPVTAAAVMTLVDAGKIALDDPVEKYLPEFREQPGPGGRHHAFTIRRLLTHTSGLLGNPPTRRSAWPIGGALDDSWLVEPLPGIVSSIARTTLEFEPGAKVAYSNPGFFVLGRLIEVVSGRPFAAYLKEKILGPLDMRDTVFQPDPARPDRVAVLYGKHDSAITTVFRFRPSLRVLNTAPDGGLFSHPGDIYKFARMFQQNGGKVLSRKSVDEMLREQAPGRGLGWAIEDGVTAHAGSSGTKVWFERSGRIAILFLQYRDRPDSIDALRDRFRRAALEGK